MRYLRRITSVVAAVAVLSLAAPAAASPLAPGGAVAPVPSDSGFSSGWPFLELAGGSSTWGSGAFFGNYAAAVYERPGGGLDFLYQVGPNGQSLGIGQLWMNSFAGFDTDVFYYVEEGTVVPTSASRTAGGDTVSFHFDPTLAPGAVSKIMVIRTNATNYTRGTFQIWEGSAGLAAADANSVTVDTWAPAGGPVVPEPATLTLTGLGLAGAVARRRRSRRAN